MKILNKFQKFDFDYKHLINDVTVWSNENLMDHEDHYDPFKSRRNFSNDFECLHYLHIDTVDPETSI